MISLANCAGGSRNCPLSHVAIMVGFTMSLQRRQFLLAASAVTANSFLGFGQARAGASPEAQKWLDKFGGTMGGQGPLVIQRFSDPMYILTNPISWKPEKDSVYKKAISVPKGFVTDLTSVPPLFFSVLRPDGDYVYAAIIHDWCYWNQHVTRDEADTVINDCMVHFKISALDRVPIHEMVKLAGQGPWDQNAKLKKAGERRVLAKFPEDPLTSWDTWKKKAGVFVEPAPQ